MGTCLYIRRIRSGLPFWERRRRAIVRESCCRQGYASVLETQQEMRRLRGVLSAPSVHSKEPLCRGMSSEGAKENAEMVRRPAGGVEYRKGQGGAECEIWQRGSVYLGRTGLALEKYNFFPPPISTRSPRCLSPLLVAPAPLAIVPLVHQPPNLAHHTLDIAQHARCAEATSVFPVSARPHAPTHSRSPSLSTGRHPFDAHPRPAHHLQAYPAACKAAAARAAAHSGFQAAVEGQTSTLAPAGACSGPPRRGRQEVTPTQATLCGCLRQSCKVRNISTFV